MRGTAGMLGALFLVSCGVTPTPVPVRGDTARLEGQWYGEYSSVMTGRSGSIEFILSAGADTAQGEVIMLPSGVVPNTGSSVPEPGSIPPAPHLLRIHLVRVFGQQVAGQLEPYEDPECRCIVTTIFSGRMEGDVIEGKFFTYQEGREVATEGIWRVTRRP